MQVHWEKLGILGPVYGLVGRGFRNSEIADKLEVSEENVRRCVSWLLRFGSHGSRPELLATKPTDRPRGGRSDQRNGNGLPIPAHREPIAGENGAKVQSIAIQPGAMLMREGFLLPDSLEIESSPYSKTWRLLAATNSFTLQRKLAAAGQHLFFVAGELKVIVFGRGNGAVRRGLRKVLAQNRQLHFNCTEIAQISVARLLGVSYITVVAHCFHMQRGMRLQSLDKRKLDQNVIDWACR
jgi:hypothetical protein